MGSAAAVDRVVSGLDVLADSDLDALSDAGLDALLGDLQHLGHRLEALTCRVADRWAQRGVWSSDGSKSAAARLGRDGHRSMRSARSILRRGRRLASAAHVEAGFAAGELSADQVDVLLGSAAGRDEVFARDEEMLVDQARTFRVAELYKLLDYWRHRVDAESGVDGTEPSCSSSLSLTPVGDIVVIDGQLDPVGGAIITTTIEEIADQLAADDRACAAPERSRPVLRAAALVEMARRAMAMPDGAQRARILLQVVAGHDSFAGMCELSNGAVIRPGHLLPYLDALDVRSIIFDSATQAVATSSQRTFTGALRGVVQVRDRHCQHPSGCDEPSDRCDVDHITPWAAGGVTSQENGRLLCRFHNRIEPQHTRPPATSQKPARPDVRALTEAFCPAIPPPDGMIYIYEISYAELLELGP